MSDINELIARNAVMAYNEGLDQGKASERERILNILASYAPHLTTDGLIQLIKGVEN